MNDESFNLNWGEQLVCAMYFQLTRKISKFPLNRPPGSPIYGGANRRAGKTTKWDMALNKTHLLQRILFILLPYHCVLITNYAGKTTK